MRAMRFLVVCGLSFLLMMLQGCAIWGVGLTLTAKNNDFPVSFSEGILGYDNELVLQDGYEVVHHFIMEKSHFTWNAWNLMWGNRERFDLSDEFEEVVRIHNGEAIVNLKIKGKEAFTFIYFLSGLLTLGLIAPHSMNVTIEGDVIRLTPTTTASAVIPLWSNNSSSLAVSKIRKLFHADGFKEGTGFDRRLLAG